MYLATNDVSNIILSIFILLMVIGITLLLFRNIRKEQKRYLEEKAIAVEGLLSKSAVTSAINSYISRITPDINFCLMYIDIDKFNDVINAFGKKEAERVVEKISFRINKELPNRVSLALYNPSQLMVFMKGEYDRFQCLDLAKKILTLIHQPVKIYRDTSVELTGSIGVCFYPKHGLKFKQLFNSLQIALQKAQQDGGNNYVVYSGEMNEVHGENVELHFEIKNAIDKREFVLYYQPIIDSEKNDIYGVEAFVRWNHPKHGLLSPIQFINIMEQSGDINWIGTWGLESIVREYYGLKRDFPYKTFIFTMNLSPKQLMNDEIATEFNKVIKKLKMPNNLIALEISEFSIYEKNSLVKQNLTRLKKLGFLIAINGFGLDYSTLSKLDSMPIDIIKLDRKFFQNEKESFMKEKVVDLIVDFAKEKDKLIIAEGIENEQMLNSIKESKIYMSQGYYYAKPMISSDLNNYIRKGVWVIPNKNDNDEFSKSNSTIPLESLGKPEGTKENTSIKQKGLGNANKLKQPKSVPEVATKPSENLSDLGKTTKDPMKEVPVKEVEKEPEKQIIKKQPNMKMNPELEDHNNPLKPEKIETINQQPDMMNDLKDLDDILNNQNKKKESPSDNNKDLKNLDDIL